MCVDKERDRQTDRDKVYVCGQRDRQTEIKYMCVDKERDRQTDRDKVYVCGQRERQTDRQRGTACICVSKAVTHSVPLTECLGCFS